jgi:hypothetical protein
MPAFVPPVTPVAWAPSYRIVPSRFPPIQLFERVARPEDLDAVFAVEALTNTRLRDEAGDLRLVPPDERVTGPGASWLMAPFTHLSVPGGRFSTPFFGAYYAARDQATAEAETIHHRERFLAATRQPPIEIDMRVIQATLRAELHDIRGMQGTLPQLYDRDDYAASQAFATRLRAARSRGIAWDSVRRDGGECAAVFSPSSLADARQGAHLTYVWDGTRIVTVYEKSELRTP